jgi:hypothetical protein
VQVDGAVGHGFKFAIGFMLAAICGAVVVVFVIGAGMVVLFGLGHSAKREVVWTGSVAEFAAAAKQPDFAAKCEGRTICVVGIAAGDPQALKIDDEESVEALKLISPGVATEVLCSFAGSKKVDLAGTRKGDVVTASGVLTRARGMWIVSCR